MKNDVHQHLKACQKCLVINPQISKEAPPLNSIPVAGKVWIDMIGLLQFSFQPVLHDWCNKGRGMYYPVCGMMHIKEPLLLTGKSNICGGSGFALSLSGCSSVDSVPAFEAVGRRIDPSQWTQLQFGLFSPFQPVVHNWFIKGRGMYCSVYGKVHIKDPLLLIEKSSLCGGSGFPSKKCVNVTI